MIGIIATYKATFLHCLQCAFCLLITFLIITSYFSEGSGRSFQTGNAAINSLQEWCRRRTKYHEVSQYYVHHAETSAALIILKNVQDLHIHLVITIVTFDILHFYGICLASFNMLYVGKVSQYVVD